MRQEVPSGTGGEGRQRWLLAVEVRRKSWRAEMVSALDHNLR